MNNQELYPLLCQIQSPTDLHKFSKRELKQLCDEVRNAILNKVSKTGGHLSSNLGTVELTVALYATHSIPPDKICWDTGHQAYPHKLLTGRLDRFETLRQQDGLSGFLKLTESEHDHWGAGHACTAISAALGYAAARDRKGNKERVIAITGDAALGGGMAWEALNNAAQLKTDITVVLNDNKMSIAENVGALSHHFAKLRTRPWFLSAEDRAKRVVKKFPKPVQRAAAGLKHSVTHYFAPEDTGAIFEELGFQYIGPIDGHNLDVMLDVFSNIKEMSGPIFVHCITVKGKGYEVAETDARKWHGVVPFDQDKCEMPKAAGPVSYTQVFGETILDIAKEDPEVAVITAAMPDGTGLTKFSQQLPEQYYDVGIAEQHAVTFAAGLAAGGLKPACAIYSTFLQRGFDQLLHDVAIQNLPVRFFMDRAGLVGADGATHHGAFDISFLSFIPNMVLLSPRDTTELAEMIRWSMNYSESPCAVRYPRGTADDTLPETRTPIKLAKSEILKIGKDITLLAIGSMVSTANRAAKELEKEGIDAEVINARFIKPLDANAILESINKTKRLITIEENVQTGGFGEAVAKLIRESNVSCKHQILALPDKFIEQGTQNELLSEVGLTVSSICNFASEIVRK